MIDNFDELVAKCEARRRRQLIRRSFTIVAALLLGIAAFGAYLQWFKTEEPKPTPAQPAIPLKTELNTTLPLSTEANQSIAPVIQKTPVATPLPQSKPAAAVPTAVPSASATVLPKPAVTVVQSPVSNAPQPAPLSPVSAKSASLFDVESQQTPADPIKAYAANPKYETALAAARDFYAKGDYPNAAIWAKKANQLNREAEEAWLLYARSYYAQGRKTDAIGVLELYLNYKDSKAATELLRTWKPAQAN